MAKEEDFYQVSLKTILRNDRGEILILKAPQGSVIEGFWDCPGGRIDTDEYAMPIPEIIARELQEEMGAIEYTLHYTPVALGRREVPPEYTRHKRVIRQLFVFFEADFKSGIIRISNEHSDYQWVDLQRINLEEYFTTGILEGIQMYTRSRKQARLLHSLSE